MKSTTLRRSNITREKVAMLEALSRYNREHQDEDLYRKQSKNKEMDALWQSFGVKPQKTEKEFKEIHMDIQVDSTYLDNLKNVIEEYDLVFFAPQVLSHIKEYENYGVKVIGIHSYDFGSWNFHKIINIALCA